jgi:hypothetical protein
MEESLTDETRENGDLGDMSRCLACKSVSVSPTPHAFGSVGAKS